MHHFATTLCAGITVHCTFLAALHSRLPLMEAARDVQTMEKLALKETTAACKAEAKEKKIRWPASRKFVSNCVAKAVKLTPGRD